MTFHSRLPAARAHVKAYSSVSVTCTKMCVDTSALLRDLLSHPIIRVVHSHQPLLQDGSLKGNLLRADSGVHFSLQHSDPGQADTEAPQPGTALIRDFLTNRPQVVRIGDNTSSTLVLSTGTPQGCVLSPALFTLFTSDCSAIHSTNTIVKFADDTTIVGLISDNDEIPLQRGDPAPYSVVLKQQPCSEHQQDQGGHSGLQEVQEDRARSSPHPRGSKGSTKRLFFLRKLKRAGLSPQLLTKLLQGHNREHPLRIIASVQQCGALPWPPPAAPPAPGGQEEEEEEVDVVGLDEDDRAGPPALPPPGEEEQHQQGPEFLPVYLPVLYAVPAPAPAQPFPFAAPEPFAA
ncbi:hypothetical protein L3Q82_013530 [Scortum barcoo]|uniref:Uncharacterized protein n=1 Tax=Scortum barcoo TaxID=214431 RepID=A0ACB8W0S7_9TELE|nr:hypothetical protein L3Q82_013530 [Scortum barcoo]